jgi:hypothetical protein
MLRPPVQEHERRTGSRARHVQAHAPDIHEAVLDTCQSRH